SRVFRASRRRAESAKREAWWFDKGEGRIEHGDDGRAARAEGTIDRCRGISDPGRSPGRTRRDAAGRRRVIDGGAGNLRCNAGESGSAGGHRAVAKSAPGFRRGSTAARCGKGFGRESRPGTDVSWREGRAHGLLYRSGNAGLRRGPGSEIGPPTTTSRARDTA